MAHDVLLEMPPQVLLVSCTHPEDGVEALAEALVEARLAACAQVTRGLQSIYRWQGKIESAAEARVDLKTTTDRLAALMEAIARLHPYDVPEIVALPITTGSEAYLDWIRQQTRATS